MPAKLTIPSGARYARWVVLGEAARDGSCRRFHCRCDCGAVRMVRLTHLRQGVSKSCGCLSREEATRRATTHGYSKDPVHRVWHDMMRRCHNPKHRRFKDWGGRGIAVCPEWHNFENFRKWALTSDYREGLLIDRIDNDGDYESGNCRWCTMKEQGNNRRNNKILTHAGRTMTQTQWADCLGMNPMTLSYRLRIGWSVRRAIETPVDKRYSRMSA